jgi:hypothetical protein
MKKNQKGFSALEGLLIVVIVGMLGGVGWYVWHSQQQVDKTYFQTSNSSVRPRPKISSTTSPQSSTNKEDPNKDYLVIKEWGVKLPMADADKVSYSYLATCSDPSGIGTCDSTIGLNVNSELLQDKTCKISVGMSRYTSFDQRAADSFTKVGKYYFGEGGSPYNCGNDHDNNLNAKLREEFDRTKLQTT